MSVQSSLVMHPIHAFGSDAQKDKYLPDLGLAAHFIVDGSEGQDNWMFWTY